MILPARMDSSQDSHANSDTPESRRAVHSDQNSRPSSNPFSLAEYLQLSELTKQSVRIEVDLDGISGGHVEIVEGDVWNAEVELLANEAWNEHAGLWTGDEAITIMLSSPHNIESVTILKGLPPIRRIWESTSSLLLNVAVLSDHDASGVAANSPGLNLLKKISNEAANTIQGLCIDTARFLDGPFLIGFVDLMSCELDLRVESSKPGNKILADSAKRTLDRLCACFDQTPYNSDPSKASNQEESSPEIVFRADGLQCLLLQLGEYPVGLVIATEPETRLGDAYSAIRRLASHLTPLLSSTATDSRRP